MPLSPGVSFGVTNADGTLKRRQEFQVPNTSMVHDFMVTERHIMLPILPLSMSLERAMTGRPPVAWEPEKGAYVGVMRRDGDVADIRWFNTEACYVFHPLNAWEEGDKLYADVMRYDVAPLFPNADGSPPKARPVLVVQADAYNVKIGNLIVAAITTNLAHASDPASVLIEVRTHDGRASGLRQDSVVSCINIATIADSLVAKTIGKLSGALMRKVNDALKTALDVP